MPVALYLRVSTEEQCERQSIATQREFAERYCALHQFSISAVYADDGVSGTVPLILRPAGARILPDARLHRFDQLLVYRLDRLGRDTRLTLQAVAELEQCGVRVKSLTEEFDTATASGRLMLTLLSGFAAHEREVIRERSLAGTQRVAAHGGWLGGAVPYGYRKGDRRQAGLIVSEQPMTGLEVSEAEVIRRIFRMAAEERQSCRHIADYLNALGVPCARIRQGSSPSPAPSGKWRAGRVRNLLISTVYKGQHVYGKRSRSPKCSPIVRRVPAIVSEAMWQQAQATLEHNFRFGPRHCRHAYLLRGLVKCGLCGLTYIGMTVRSRSGRQESYYRCNGKHDTYGVYGAMGQRCPSKDVQAGWLEQAVWEEIEGMLRRPEPVLARLKQRLAQEQKELAGQRVQVVRLRQALSEKGQERDRVLSLYRKGRITEDAVERQMQQMAQEEDTLRGELSELSARLAGIGSEAAQLAAARTALEALGARLQEPLSWEARRQLVESLVERVRVDTREQAQERIARITATYRFSASAAIRQGPAKAQRVGARIEDRAPRLELIISNGRRTSRQRVAMPATA
ncbi:MAG TPA: recombinase family protein [Bryobacteraceae bacterium]|jgi:site-specific DNA recombinase|nr:recombinase family protein [Bryobacteraceae bacterium]